MKTLIVVLSLLCFWNVYSATSLTYTKDIQPIFKNRCSQCHDYMGDKNWQVYENAFSHKDKIKEKIISKEMPIGKNMPQSERDLIVEWVNEGAKK